MFNFSVVQRRTTEKLNTTKLTISAPTHTSAIQNHDGRA
eukprot:SAG31_NODE_29503_length_394_cov_0.874576_2_plen_39_part_01